MYLVISEKPSVAQSISKVLGATDKKDGYYEGNNYIVSWCIGHLVKTAEPESYDEKYKNWNVLPVIPSIWKYSVVENTKKQFNVIKKLMSDSRVTTIVCATDAGREGELIFRHVYTMAGCRKPFKRLWISSLEDNSIRQGFEDLKDGSEYDNLYKSALCRERADWLIGINATRYFTNAAHKLLTIGRVQTPTLSMIVDRANEKANFVKQKYYTVDIDCGDFTATSKRIDDTEAAKTITAHCNVAVVASVLQTEKSQHPPKLYDLTTLQRDAIWLHRTTNFGERTTLV